MDLKTLRNQWDELGRLDPMWAVISWPQKAGGRWQASEFFATGREEVNCLLRHLSRLSRPVSGERVLDFGCGLGRISQALAEHFRSVDGVDIAPSMIDQAQSYNQFPDRVKYHLNERDDLQLFPANQFDLIYSNITLQHMSPCFAKKYIQEFVRILKPNGTLVFQIPSTPAWTIKGMLWRFLPLPVCGLLLRWKTGQTVNMEMHGVSKSEIRRLLARQGAQVIESSLNSEAGADWTSYLFTVTKTVSGQS